MPTNSCLKWVELKKLKYEIMTNKYLEKIASWDRLGKFVGNVTGSRARAHAKKMRNVFDYIAKKETPEHLEEVARNLGREKTRDQVTAGVAAAGTVAGAAYGVHKIRDKQREETARQYEQLWKSAGLAGAGKELGQGIFGGVGRAIKRVSNRGVDLVHTATGGKIMEYGRRSHGFAPGGHADSLLYNAKDNKERINIFREHGKKMDDLHLHTDLTNLTKHRKDARLAIGGIGTSAALGVAYAKKKPDPENY